MTYRKMIAFAASLVLTLCGISVAQQQGIGWHFDMMRASAVVSRSPYPPYTNMLACWYPLESDLVDASGNGIAAGWIGGGVPSFSSGGVLMPGNRYINVTNNWVYTNLNVAASFVVRARQPTLQTASCWLYIRKAAVGNSFNGGPNNDAAWIRLQTNNANRIIQSGASIMPSNTIYSYAVSFSGTTERAYVNGIQWATSSGWTNDALVPATDMRFGEFNTAFMPTNSVVYEILIYTNALSSNQMMEVHQWCDARD